MDAERISFRYLLKFKSVNYRTRSNTEQGSRFYLIVIGTIFCRPGSGAAASVDNCRICRHVVVPSEAKCRKVWKHCDSERVRIRKNAPGSDVCLLSLRRVVATKSPVCWWINFESLLVPHQCVQCKLKSTFLYSYSRSFVFMNVFFNTDSSLMYIYDFEFYELDVILTDLFDSNTA